MTYESFGWSPRVNPQGEIKFRVLAAQFGDGYVQTAADGINNRSESWPLEFVGASAQVSPIKAFLDRHAGHKAFLWTPPLGDPGYYRAAKYGLVAMGGDMYSLSVTFDQVFKP